MTLNVEGAHLYNSWDMSSVWTMVRVKSKDTGNYFHAMQGDNNFFNYNLLQENLR